MHPLVADYQSSLDEVLSRLASAEAEFHSTDSSGKRNGDVDLEDEEEETAGGK